MHLFMVLNQYVLICCMNDCNDCVFIETRAVCGNVDCRVVSLQSGLSEPDKEENKPTSDSDDGYSKDLVISFLTCNKR